MKKIILAGLLILAMVFSIAACSSSDDKQAETVEESKTIRIAYLTQQLSNEFMQSLNAAVHRAGKEAGFEVTTFSADLDPVKQMGQIETAVNQGFDAIIIDPCASDALIPGIRYAQEAGVPIVTMHEDVSDGSADASAVSDLRQAGVFKMQRVADDLGGKGRIAIINGQQGQLATAHIRGGYQDVLDKYPDIEVIFEDSGDWSTEPAIRIMETWVATGEHLDAVIGMNDAAALGIIYVLEAAGINDVLIYGLDAQTEVLRMIKEGRIAATILIDLNAEADAAVDLVRKLLNGQTVQKVNIIDVVVISPENIDYWIGVIGA